MVTKTVVLTDFFEEFSLRNLINFTQNNNMLTFIGVDFQKLFIMDCFIGCRCQINDNVTIPDGFKCLFKHVLIEELFSLMEPGSINKNNLIVIVHNDSVGTFTGCIGFLADKSNFFTQNPVHESAFSRIWAPYESNKASFTHL